MRKKMQIAIDGPAGAGKSTIAKRIAQEKGIVYLDTGAMYRAITYGIIKTGGDFSDKQAIIDFTEHADICFRKSDVYLNQQKITTAIRTPKVSRHTSDVACIPEVRACLVKQQRVIAANTSVIMDGRDIGSVVLPDADFKFYLDASVDERAKRRFDELSEKGDTQSFEEIRQDILKRDYNDSHREAGPLVCCKDAIVVDTTGLDIQGVCDRILSIIG